MTGLYRDETLNKKVTEVLPELKSSSFDWIGTYGKVALTRENASFESYSEPLQRWYEVTAYSDAPGFFVTLFRDITERKEMEEVLRMSEYLLNDSQATSKAGGCWTDEVYRIYGVTKDYDPSNIDEDISFYYSADHCLQFVVTDSC